MASILNRIFCDIAWEPETTRFTFPTNADGTAQPLSDQTGRLYLILLIAAVVLLVIVAAAIIINLSVKAHKASEQLKEAELGASVAAALSDALNDMPAPAEVPAQAAAEPTADGE